MVGRPHGLHGGVDVATGQQRGNAGKRSDPHRSRRSNNLRSNQPAIEKRLEEGEKRKRRRKNFGPTAIGQFPIPGASARAFRREEAEAKKPTREFSLVQRACEQRFYIG